MKKKIFLFAAACLIAAATLSASVIAPSPHSIIPPPEMIDIGYGIKIPAEQLLILTPKQYRELTGHRLGLFRSIALKKMQKNLRTETGQKSQIVAAILCFFLGPLGIHRFYLGYNGAGVAQLLTAGGLGIWWIIDLVRICTGDLKPKNGEYKDKF